MGWNTDSEQPSWLWPTDSGDRRCSSGLTATAGCSEWSPLSIAGCSEYGSLIPPPTKQHPVGATPHSRAFP